LLVDRAGMMLSQKAVEAGGADFTRKPGKAGTGPFFISEAVKDNHITLERNPNYWEKDKNGVQLPYLDKITIRPITSSDVRFTNLRTGDAQVANNIAGKDVPTAQSDSTLSYQQKPAYAFRSLIPNEQSSYVFSEHRYVKAVSMAIDRKELLDKGYFGLGAVGYGTIAPNHFAFDASFKPFETADPSGAKKLVADVGKGPLTFELLISAGDPGLLQLAQLIQAQLKKADITADIQQLQFAQILDLQNKHTFKGLTFVGWSGRVDPDGNTYDHVYTLRPFNDSAYSNKQVDQLLDLSRQTTDEAKRKDAFRKAEQIYVVDDPARVWLGFGAAQLLTAKKVVAPTVYPDQIVRFEYMSMAAK
jgi:peptide/nickel transport system substrate-binding protein